MELHCTPGRLMCCMACDFNSGEPLLQNLMLLIHTAQRPPEQLVTAHTMPCLSQPLGLVKV